MVHVNDQTVNDEATIPFGGMGASGNGSRYGGDGQPGRVHRVAVGHRPRRARARTRTRTEPRHGVHHRGREARRASRRPPRRASSPTSDYPVSAATRERVLEAARTLDYVPNALARGLLKSHVPVVGGHRPRHHRPVLRGGRPRRRGRGRRPPASSSSPAAPSAIAERERVVRPAAALDARGGRRLRRQRARRPGRSTRRSTATWRRCAPYGAAVVHLSPHALGEPEVGVDNAGGIAAMVAALVGPRPPADRVPRRARRRCSSRASALAGYRRGLADAGIAVDERLVVPHGFDREGGAARRRRRCSPAACRSRRSAAPTTCWRSAPSQRLAELGDRRPRTTSRSPASTTSPSRPITAPEPVHRARCPLREMGRRGFEHVDRAARRAAARPARCCPPRSSCATRPRPQPTPRGTPMSLNVRGHHPRVRPDPRRRRPLRRARLPPLSPVAPPAGPGRARHQRRHGRGPAPLARRARAGPPRRGRGGGRRPGHRRPVRPVHGAGGRGGEARRGRRRPGPARVPDPGLPGHAARSRDPGRLPRGDRARLRPADGRVPAPARAGRRHLQRGDAPADRGDRQRRSRSRRRRSTPGCTC